MTDTLKAKHPVHPIVVLDYRVRLPGMLFIASFALDITLLAVRRE